MKILRLLACGIAVAICMGFYSCNDDDKGGHYIPSNASGIMISWDSHSVETQPGYFWIDNYMVKFIYYESTIDERLYSPKNEIYKPFTMDLVYSDLSNSFHIPNITDKTDFSNFVPNPTKYIQYMKTLVGKYDYIYLNRGEPFLFNRTSSENIQ